jgi:hypothetical protein
MVLTVVIDGRLTALGAAELMSLSCIQERRLRQRPCHPDPAGATLRSYARARARAEVREHLDGSASAHYQGRCIACRGPQPADLRTKRRGTGEQPASPPPLNTATRRPLRTEPTKPAPDHPWRRSIVTA